MKFLKNWFKSPSTIPDKEVSRNEHEVEPLVVLTDHNIIVNDDALNEDEAVVDIQLKSQDVYSDIVSSENEIRLQPVNIPDILVNDSTNEKEIERETEEEEQLRLKLIDEYVKNELALYNVTQAEINRKTTPLSDNDEDYYGPSKADLTNKDELFADCARIVVQMQLGSSSNIQRRFNLGYNRAGRIMDQLEAASIVGPAVGSKPREVYFKTEPELEQFLRSVDIPYSKSFNNTTSLSFPANFYDENRKIFYGKQIIDDEIKMRQEEIDRIREAKIQIEKDKIRKSLLERERKKQLHKDVYKTLIEEGHIESHLNDSTWKREPIPQDVMDRVWNRDGGKCVKCGSQENLEFDHIIPHSKGGANTYRNLQILCMKCNGEKSNKIG